MAKARWSVGLLLSGVLLGGSVASGLAQTGDKFSTVKPDPQKIPQILQFKPHQEGIDYAKPTAEEVKNLTLKVIVVDGAKSTGYLLVDQQNRPLRRFFARDGNQIDTYSYYKDGVEVYRELDTNGNGKIDQYRWLNSGGIKWGIDANEDGKIDSWKMISAEEAAQEAYQAVVNRDFARLRMLFISEEEIRALKLPDAHAASIREAQAKALIKFQDLGTKATNLTPQAAFVRVESAVPQCIPADVRGPIVDVLRFPTRAILYQTSNKSHEWLHTGEMIQVGLAWRLIDAPTINDIIESGANPAMPTQQTAGIDPALQKLLDDLNKLGNPPDAPANPGRYPAVVDYMTKRTAILEQIYAKVTDAKEKEIWMRQVLDTLCTGHQANKGDNSLLTRLGQYKNQLAQSTPGSGVAGYAHYREMWARFSFALAGDNPGLDPVKVQRDWNEELAKFVAAYPKAEDAPDALLQLAMSSEYAGKDKQEEAKKYYSLIATNFPEHPLAPKAAGAAKRLDLNGKTMQLAAPTLQGGQFELAKLSGKVVVVYYWTSNTKMCVSDFAVMKQLQTANSSKGLEIVTVSLDETVQTALGFLTANPLPGTHLFLAGDQSKGLESPLATQYGIVGVPTIILVGKDGRVIDRSIQVNELEDAIKKAL